MRLAVLYQSAPPPPVDGIRKPMKEGGYADSGADIAFALKNAGVEVVTSVSQPDPRCHRDWVFSDDEEGIGQSLDEGADCLWLNTVLYAMHPIHKFHHCNLHIVGQDPGMVDVYDDKFKTNALLRSYDLPVVRSQQWFLGDLTNALPTPHKPLVIKPIRGRGSQGVQLLDDKASVQQYLTNPNLVAQFGEIFMLEPYLPGQEVTVSVMPAGRYEIQGKKIHQAKPWCLPVVVRENHLKGITPYNGVEAVVDNSFVGDARIQEEPKIRVLLDHCARAAEILNAKSVIRIDARADQNNDYYIFDVNLKPNMTGRGRPGRSNQDGLTTMAARSIGWDYEMLLKNLLGQRWLLTE